MSIMPNTQIAQIKGNALAFYEWGQKGNPVLICLHSHTNSAASWREFAEFASYKYHVFALDQPGTKRGGWQFVHNPLLGAGKDRHRPFVRW